MISVSRTRPDEGGPLFRGAGSSEAAVPGVVLDFDRDAQLVGIDIDQASEIVALSRLEAEALPLCRVPVKASAESIE
jgi:hypothetical protein